MKSINLFLVLLLTLVISMPANAQLGGLIKKAKKAVNKSTNDKKTPPKNAYSSKYDIKSGNDKLLDNFESPKSWPLTVFDDTNWFTHNYDKKDISAEIKQKMPEIMAKYKKDSTLLASIKSTGKGRSHKNYSQLNNEVETYNREMKKVRNNLTQSASNFSYNYKLVEENGEVYITKYGKKVELDKDFYDRIKFTTINCAALFGENDPDVVKSKSFLNKLMKAGGNSTASNIKTEVQEAYKLIFYANKMIYDESDGKYYMTNEAANDYSPIQIKEALPQYKKAIKKAIAELGEDNEFVQKHKKIYSKIFDAEKNTQAKMAEKRVEYLKYKPMPKNVKEGEYVRKKMLALFKQEFPDHKLIHSSIEKRVEANNLRTLSDQKAGKNIFFNTVDIDGQVLSKKAGKYYRTTFGFRRKTYHSSPNTPNESLRFYLTDELPESGIPEKYRK